MMAAAALQCLGGELQAQLWPTTRREIEQAREAGIDDADRIFTIDDLSRYPLTSRIAFVECAGNSGAMFAKEPVAANVQAIHGLLSCSEWTGVKLSVLLEEAGIDPRGKWRLGPNCQER